MIQAPLDKNPKSSWQELAPQIHAIGDETHREIHAQGEKTGDLLRLRQRRQSHLLRRLNMSGIRPNRKVLSFEFRCYEE